MSVVNRESPIPAYYQIALDLRNRIAQKEWEEGERIPSENELANDYGVSRITLRQALAELVKDDVLLRQRGSGTFVNKNPIPLVHDLSLPHILAGRLRDMGLETSSQIIEAQTFPDPLPEVQSHLKIEETTPVAYLKRVLLIGNEPTALNRSWFDDTRCPGIAEQELIDSSLSKTLRERYGLVPAYASNWLEVIRSPQETALLLGNMPDMPMIVVFTVSYLEDNTPLEYSITEWMGDRIRFKFQSTFAPDTSHQASNKSISLGDDDVLMSSLREQYTGRDL